ncbi:hypothetical protein QYE76_020606 [Lolium multiflorum]|uniref:FRIGIDA-like protein n=1 Tax=Lolium multiflorum TaxID=4521 RepID=A0AAD8R8X2_LOLMU|nr:hypothetical protein QYE76_020606 [Lolium multiflorum]
MDTSCKWDTCSPLFSAFCNLVNVKIPFLVSTWLSSPAYFSIQRRRFTAPLYKISFFYLEHFLSPFPYLQNFLLRPTTLRAHPSQLHSSAIVDATASLDRAHHAENQKLAETNERADILAQKLEQCEEARKKAESDAVQARREADKAKADAAGVEDLRKRLHAAETSLSEHITAQSAREEAITKRLRTQNRCFVNMTSQEFELEDPDNDSLLDAVSFLEFHGTEAREGIDEARTGLSRLFPYFFPKKEEPATFLALAKCFNPPEDLGLKMRHENMKVAVESTVVLVADSQQTIDWAKVGNTEQIEQAKWRSLIKAAKLNTKKILAYLGIKPSSTPSSSRPEV